MNILFQEDADEFITIELNYYIYKVGDRESLIVYPTKDDAPKEVRSDVKIMKGKFKVPDFCTHTEIVKDSMVYKNDGIAYNSFVNYKDNCIKLLLKEVSTDDKTVKVDEKNYGRLNPTVAEHLFAAFNEQYLNPVIDIEAIKKEKEKEKASQ